MDSQVGNLEACFDSSRPIRDRKVEASGTNGVGGGTGGDFLCKARRQLMQVYGRDRRERKREGE